MGNFHISLLFYPYILPLLGKLVFAEYYTIFVKYQSSAKYDRKPPPPTARRLSAPPPTKGGFYKNLVPGFWVSFVERLTKRSVFCIIGALPIRRVVRVVEGAALEMLCTQVPRVRIPNSPPKKKHHRQVVLLFSLQGGMKNLRKGVSLQPVEKVRPAAALFFSRLK